jgi:hypothetical protein
VALVEAVWLLKNCMAGLKAESSSLEAGLAGLWKVMVNFDTL